MTREIRCDADSVITQRIQFYSFIPSPYTCLSRSNSGWIAAGRENGSLDVYDEEHHFFMICHIPSSSLGSVESVAWYKERLYSVGATGVLSEIDVLSSTVKVGNDDGFVTLYTLSPKISYSYALPKFDGKILSTVCNQKNSCLAVSTSKGSLTTYVKKKKYEHKYCLVSESDKCIIWSLTFACGFLLSGNSEGSVNVWDVTVGGLLYSFPSHLGDVLTLTTSPDEKTVYSGGSDALVRKYELCTSEDGDMRWELSGILRGCRRDIRGLACIPQELLNPDCVEEDHAGEAPQRLLACGLDARLQLLACAQTSSARHRIPAHRVLPAQVGVASNASALPYWPASICCPPPVTGLASESHAGRLALLQYPSHLSLVRLGRSESGAQLKLGKRQYPREGHQLSPILEGALRLAEIQPRKGAELVTSALSPCGQFVAYSDCQRTRILCFSTSVGAKNVLLPKVTVSRLTWPAAGEVRRDRPGSDGGDLSPHPASSSETNTDTDEFAEEGLSPTNLATFFNVTVGSREAKTNPFAVASRCSPTSTVGSPLGVPSRCLAFTPDSRHLIMVQMRREDMNGRVIEAQREDYSLVCVSLKSGAEVWRVRIARATGSNHPVHVHSLSVSHTWLKHLGYLIALGCLDGRVRLHASSSGAEVFTCPCLDSPTGHPPLPVSVAFRRDRGQVASEAHLCILYTNSQLMAWTLTAVVAQTHDGEQPVVSVSADLNPWLVSFWRRMGREVQSTLGVFHSLVWLSGHSWMLASDNFIVVLTAKKPYWSGMMKELMKEMRKAKEEEVVCCLRVSTDFESILQVVAVSPRELAVVTVDSATISLGLSAPMQRKAFGT